MFQISACIWSLTTSPAESLDRVQLAGFEAADCRPDTWDGLAGPEEFTDRGLSFGCAGLLPLKFAPGLSLDTIATEDAGRVLPYLYGAIERAAHLGARRAYMLSPNDPDVDRGRYRHSMELLASHAAEHDVKLCIEPTPGKALPNDAAVLDFVHEVGHENLYVLIDLGHCLITNEDPSQSVRNAGDRLGYVHIDDNDGISDRHFALFDGVLKPQVIDSFLRTLAASGYDGGLGLELKNTLPSPLSGMVAARDYIRSWELRKAA